MVALAHGLTFELRRIGADQRAQDYAVVWADDEQRELDAVLCELACAYVAVFADHLPEAETGTKIERPGAPDLPDGAALLEPLQRLDGACDFGDPCVHWFPPRVQRGSGSTTDRARYGHDCKPKQVTTHGGNAHVALDAPQLA